MKAIRFFRHFGLLVVLLSAFPSGGISAPPAPSGTQATLSADMLLLEQESQFEREKTLYLQENVLDKILGPGKAVVIVDVEMGLESRAMTMEMGKNKSEKKKNEGLNGAP